jgi:hypothetical protein
LCQSEKAPGLILLREIGLAACADDCSTISPGMKENDNSWSEMRLRVSTSVKPEDSHLYYLAQKGPLQSFLSEHTGASFQPQTPLSPALWTPAWSGAVRQVIEITWAIDAKPFAAKNPFRPSRPKRDDLFKSGCPLVVRSPLRAGSADRC